MAVEPAATRNYAFFSYSHKDGKWLDRLILHVRPLVREGQLKIFSDRDIAVGADWRAEIESALDAAGIAVLLVSVHFLASDFIMNEEVPRLLAGAANKGTKILPVIVTPSMFEMTPSLYRFQAANPPERPLNSMRQSEWQSVLANVAREIQRHVAS
jgi:TIR domain